MLTVQHISGGYGTTPLLSDISFHVDEGKMVGILGPNGCGKSTLLKVISGIKSPAFGSIIIDGKNLKHYTTRELARKMTILPQIQASAFSHTVRDTVSIGRYPHQSGFFSSWGTEDESAIRKAMQLTDIEKYENQYLEFLSGGEQQRVFIAQALAQASNLLLLDEPTNHLDIAHQKQILDMIRREVTENKLTVVSVFHDINLASLYCDDVLLMENGKVKAFGAPHEVLLEERIERVYHTKISIQPHPEQPKPQMTILPVIQEQAKEKRITMEHVKIKEEYIELRSHFPLRVLSSAVHNAGMGWYANFMNRTVKADYNIDYVKEEYIEYLASEGFSPTNTVGMMTAVDTKKAVIKKYEMRFGEVFIVVTAGIGNAIDVSQSYKRNSFFEVGTINTWVIINGKLSDEAFVQAMMTATESKSKAMQQEEVYDSVSNTLATGTPTDSLLIAATQHGAFMQYGGPITELGRIIGKGVFEATVEAIQSYRKGDSEDETLHENRG